MSTKERHHEQVFAMQVRRLNRIKDKPVTAGEFSKEYGISRNTAKKYMEKYASTGRLRAYAYFQRSATVIAYFVPGYSESYPSRRQMEIPF